jgi:lycopene cyclase domain-containing protein
MTALYLALNLLSISVPFIFSFHPRIQFYKKFKPFFPAMIISGLVYLSWDVIFTEQGYWGFNPRYLIGVHFLGLPLEEWLFFICIPFASVFTHFTLTAIYPNFKLSTEITRYISWFLVGLLAIVPSLNLDKAYTSVNGYLALAILLLVMYKAPEILRHFYLTFLVVLIPFFLVNGILTGSFIEEEVVWYNNAENLGIRLFTIPVEDTFYAFGMLLLAIFLTGVFTKKSKPIQKTT